MGEHDLGYLFLSTPSARRATIAGRGIFDIKEISIHALREEGDGIRHEESFVIGKFLSTPSARRATLHVPHDVAA